MSFYTKPLSHVKTMTRGDVAFNPESDLAVFTNRVVVTALSLEEAKVVISRLPNEFLEFEPVSLEQLIAEKWRPEPNRVIYVSARKLNSPELLFLPYALITKDRENDWIDVRDQNGLKWGKVTANSETTSIEVLNGLKTI